MVQVMVASLETSPFPSSTVYLIVADPRKEAAGVNVTTPDGLTEKTPTEAASGAVPATKVTLVASISLEPFESLFRTGIVTAVPFSVVALSLDAVGPIKAETSVETVEVLLAGTGSPVGLETEAVLLRVPE